MQIFERVQLPTVSLHPLLNLLFPPRCAACGRLDTLWCADCARAIQAFSPMSGNAPALLTDALSLSAHQGPLRAVVHVLKYESDRAQACALAHALGTLMADAYTQVASDWSIDLVVPVPLHTNRLRTRGYNQADLLATALADAALLPYDANAIRRERDTGSQVGRTGSERQAEMEGAFTAQGVSNRRVLMIDDVLTTGATLSACAEALHRAGAEAVYALTLTRA